ncbi:MAG: hypothetical protein PHD47_01040, partial [Acholeplasmataceae bacterium]|nr:hypothetical protein [Acholeplasmataceae bacterium]
MIYQIENMYNKIIKGFSLLGIVAIVFISSIVMISSNITKVPVTVKLTSLFDDDNSVISTVNSNLGDTISITPPGQINDYEFVFWVINGIVNPNYKLNHSFVVQSQLELQAVFSKPDKNVVLFVDSNGKLLSYQYVLPHTSITDPYISLATKPTKPGFIVKEAPYRWLSHNGSSLENIDAHTVFTLQYEVVNTDTYSILIDNGVILNEAPYRYNDLITVEAVNKPEETFSYWLKDGVVVSYEKLYRFTAVRDTSLIAVYNSTDPVKNVLVNQSNDLKLRNDYYTYMTSFALKEGYDLVEFGYLFHPESATDLTLDLVGIIKFQMSQYNPFSNEYVASFPLGSHQSMRSYLIVRNVFNELEVHYSNQVNYPYEVNFYDENGINLLDTVYVDHGEIPFTDVVPFKTSTLEYSYQFSGWNKALIPIYSNTDYYASFSSIPINYEVTFVIDDVTQISKIVPFNAYVEPIEDPVTDDIFIGWEGLPTIMPAKDITVYAKFISGKIGRFPVGMVPNWIKGRESAIHDTFVDGYIT